MFSSETSKPILARFDRNNHGWSLSQILCDDPDIQPRWPQDNKIEKKGWNLKKFFSYETLRLILVKVNRSILRWSLSKTMSDYPDL